MSMHVSLCACAGVCLCMQSVRKDLIGLMSRNLDSLPHPIPHAWQNMTKGNPVEEVPIFLQLACYHLLQGH